MSNDLNQCNFIGRLGNDPEARFLPDGTAVTSISIAVGWKSRDKEGAEWVPVTAFGKLAEIMSQYLKKGSQVYISGRFKTDKYQAQDGSDRYSTKIIADRMQMLGGRDEGAKAANPSQYQSHRPIEAPINQQSSSGQANAPQAAPEDDLEDLNIPF